MAMDTGKTSEVEVEEEEEDEFEMQLRQEELERQAKASGDGLSKGLTYTDEDGTVMEWDHERRAYFPKIDADFIAQYQINYGSAQSENGGSQDMTEEEKQAKEQEYWRYYYSVYSQQQPVLPKFDEEGNPIVEEDEEAKKKKSSNSQGEDDQSGNNQESDGAAKADAESKIDPTSDEHYQYNLYYYGQEYADAYRDYYRDHPDDDIMPDWMNMNSSAGQGKTEKQAQDEAKKGKKKGEKRKEPPREEGWFETDTEKSTQMYVSGLPSDITEEEYKELMSKCGLIMFDPFTRKPKLKLYKDKAGNLKGDGLCTYIKAESVELALQILDGFEVRGHTITVERAKFEMKGDYDPKKKKKKLSNKQKQKLKEKQEKLFDWRPDKNPFERAKHERIVILKNMFDIHEFEVNPALINELRADVREECTKSGEVKKVTLYDRHPEGVISVMFKEAEEADACIAALNGRWFAKRRIIAFAHDGKTKYDITETEEERAKRIKDWQHFLETGETASTTSAKTSSEQQVENPGKGSGGPDLNEGGLGGSERNVEEGSGSGGVGDGGAASSVPVSSGGHLDASDVSGASEPAEGDGS